MIKKGCLLSLVVFCSLFFLIACSGVKTPDEVKLLDFDEQEVSFDALKEVGFVPETVRLPDSYVNDKIESKAKKLSYDFYYYRLKTDEEFSVASNEKVFNPSCIFQTTTISEEDSGLDSKAKVSYEKLKKANGGGDICVGTKFVLGIRVKDQSGNLVYHAKMKRVVFAPASTAMGTDKANQITVPGNQIGFGQDVTAEGGGSVDNTKTSFDGSRTVYTLTGASGKNVRLKFGDFGLTNTVLVK